MGGGLHKQKGPLGERALEDWQWVTAGVSQGPPSSAAQGQRAHRCAHLQQLCKVMCECGFCEHEIIIDDCFFSCQYFLNVDPNCFFTGGLDQSCLTNLFSATCKQRTVLPLSAVGAQPGLGLLNADFKNKMPHCASGPDCPQCMTRINLGLHLAYVWCTKVF